MSNKEKDCITYLEEMSLKSNLFYELSKDRIIGFQEGHTSSEEIASTVLVVLARGVAYDCKQLIAYFFYKLPATSDYVKEILFESVRKLTAVGLNVMEKTLAKDDPCFFVDNTKPTYLFDIPHLLKLTRNSPFSYRFISPEGEANKTYIETMYYYEKSEDYRLYHKSMDEHICPKSFQIMKVKYACQVLSHNTSVAPNSFVDLTMLPVATKMTAYLIDKVNRSFNLLNPSHLNNFLRFKERNYSFLFTKHLNQDCLENVLGHINCSGNARNPKR
nr:unnamed protein product [Callosobruchus analis]